jgi:pimeloyl-ACP methyl ester carboxylesterase
MTVLMLHGAGGGAWEWNIWRRVFVAAGFLVHCPDLQPAAAGIEATRFDDYLAQAIGAADAAPEVVIGASLGGLLALALEAVRPCRALILVNPMPPIPEAAWLPSRATLPARIPWGRDASLPGTRAALPDADPATWHYAFRRWRDESGAVINEARDGLAWPPPRCPVAVLASRDDGDVPLAVSRALAQRLDSTFWSVSGSHVGPLLGAAAAGCAGQAVHWLNALGGFRTD